MVEEYPGSERHFEQKSTAVTVQDETQQAAVAAPAPAMDPMAIWKSIEAMALNPDVDAGKIGALLDHQERIMDRAAQQAFTFAKNSAMAEMPRITKDSRIVHPGKNGQPDKIIGRYKKYEDLRRIIDPVLTKYGLRITHETGFSEQMKMPTVTAVLSFVKDGMAWTERGGEMVLPFDSTGAKSGTQGAGSSLTYGQRYTTCAILGIVIENEDDDGAGGGRAELPAGADHQGLIDAGQRAAIGGPKAYADWLKGLTNVQKGWLITHGHHDNLAAAARDHAEG